jgi:predicted DNA-binding protein (MmcQ/YjbR family)
MAHRDQLATPGGQALLAALRRSCEGLPEVTEVIDGFGHTTFKVRGRSFLIAGMGEAGLDLAIKADPMTQEVLVRQGPYFRTPYIGQHGWVSITDPLGGDWEEIGELLRDAYRLAAPRRLARGI